MKFCERCGSRLFSDDSVCTNHSILALSNVPTDDWRPKAKPLTEAQKKYRKERAEKMKNMNLQTMKVRFEK